jgi:myo-inositol-1(or 4)-monophosphatase
MSTLNHGPFIQKCLVEASKIAVTNFGKVKGKTKPGDQNQVVTSSDIAIGALIMDKIKTEYPGYNIIDEEAGVTDNNSQFTWVIDPIDGTSNYAVGVPHYGIMMGLLDGNVPVAGGFALPFTNEITIAERNQGAFCNGKSIVATKEIELKNCLIAYHIDGHPEEPARTYNEVALLSEIILKVRNIRNSGCEPLDGFYVAIGRYGALLNKSMRLWDLVATHIIIQEAGGMVTDFWGQPIDYANALSKATTEHYTICAAIPELHQQLQQIIQKSSK